MSVRSPSGLINMHLCKFKNFNERRAGYDDKLSSKTKSEAKVYIVLQETTPIIKTELMSEPMTCTKIEKKEVGAHLDEMWLLDEEGCNNLGSTKKQGEWKLYIN